MRCVSKFKLPMYDGKTDMCAHMTAFTIATDELASLRKKKMWYYASYS